MNCILNSIIIGVIINLVLPIILKPIATEEEVNPPNGVESLSLKGQFMHMLILEASQKPFMSSIIIAIIVGLSVYLGYKLDPMKYIMKLKKST